MLHLEYFTKGSLANNLEHNEVFQFGSGSSLFLILRGSYAHTHIVRALHGGLDLLFLLIVGVFLVVIVVLWFVKLVIELRNLLLSSIYIHFIQVWSSVCIHLLGPVLGDHVFTIVTEVLGRELVNLLLLVLLSCRVAAQILLLDIVDGQVLLHLETVEAF